MRWYTKKSAYCSCLSAATPETECGMDGAKRSFRDALPNTWSTFLVPTYWRRLLIWSCSSLSLCVFFARGFPGTPKQTVVGTSAHLKHSLRKRSQEHGADHVQTLTALPPCFSSSSISQSQAEAVSSNESSRQLASQALTANVYVRSHVASCFSHTS